MVWIILAIALFFLSYFTVTFISPELGIISAISLLLFAAPSIYYLKKNKKTILSITLIGLFAYIIETTSILTGFPYTKFVYTELIGPKIFGIVPLMLPFAFLPLVIGAAYFGHKQRNKYLKYIVPISILVITDLVLDPAAVALKIWVWDINGTYYGVPFINFLGWIFTSFISLKIFYKYNTQKIHKKVTISLFLTLAFWTGATVWLQLWIPFIIGIIITTIIGKELK